MRTNRAMAEQTLRSGRMKLIIQVPCLNEEETLPQLLSELPRRVPGFERVEWLVVDDGSTDDTVEVAGRHGVDHLVRLTTNKGLATAFQAGLDAALKLGADVIVNTDADNQYRSEDIPRLVEPILAGRADMVVGDRQVQSIDHFSPSKKLLQRLGSWVVRRASGTAVLDTTSGFRRNAFAIFRAYTLYEPLRVFMMLALIFVALALAAWSPFLVDWILNGDRSGHIQSLILGAVLMLAAVQMFALGIIGDALAGQRAIAQRVYERVRRLELEAGVAPTPYERLTLERPLTVETIETSVAP